MPYITHSDKHRAAIAPQTPRELNFAITELIKGYLVRKGLHYTHLNDCLGALEGAKAEFYARVVRPYEEQKKAENGDVYGELDKV